MKRYLPLLAVVSAMFMLACNLTRALTTAPSEQPAVAIASPTPTSLPATEVPPALPPVPIVYYYFVEIEAKSPPAGSVVIAPDIYVLGPALSEKARSPDTVTNIGSALQAMLNDPRNQWTSSGVGIASITFTEGAANVALEGEYFGVGDVTLVAARDQILLTVFADDAVHTATITLNGKNIANMGISHSSQAKPEDYAYTRAEIEAFMDENAYGPPL